MFDNLFNFNKSSDSNILTIKSYKDLISKCQKDKINKLLLNSSTEHASWVIFNLLNSAIEDNSELHLIVGNFHSNAYTEVVEKKFDECMEINLRMHILLTDETSEGSNKTLINKLKNYSNATFYTKKNEAEAAPHMFVVGDSAFRYEPNPEQHKAILNFNDKDFTEIVLTKFKEATIAA